MQEHLLKLDRKEKKLEFWRTISGSLLFVALTLIFYGMIFYFFSIYIPNSFLLNQKIVVILLFGSFIIWHLTLFLVVSVLHKRSYLSLMGTNKNLNWNQFWFAVFLTISLSFLGLAIAPLESILFDEVHLPRIEISLLKDWIPWVLPACIVIFIQVSAEEMFFRGYLLQQLKGRFNSFWIWAIFPSILFGIAHYDFDTFGNNTFFYVLNAFIFGVLASIITNQSNNIGYALGMHFVNNIFGILFFGIGDNLSHLSLVKYYFDETGIYMTYIIIFQTSFQIITFLILFNWLNRNKNEKNSEKIT